MRAQVLGLEAVLADGSVFDALDPAQEGQSRLRPQAAADRLGRHARASSPRRRCGWCRRWPTARCCGPGSPRIERRARAAAALRGRRRRRARRLRGAAAATASRRCSPICPGARAPLAGAHAWHALIELVADAAGRRAPARALPRRCSPSAFERGLVEDATIAANEAQAEAFWLLRDEIAPAERAHRPGDAARHLGAGRRACPTSSTRPCRRSRRALPGTRAVAFGHLGDGNVHFHVLAPPGADARRVGGERRQGDQRAASTIWSPQWGGSISAEHGIGQLKRDELGAAGRSGRSWR